MPVSQQQPAKETPLQPGKPVGREIKGGETHTYSVWLRAGESLEIVVEQRGIDLGVTLVAPDGEPVGTADSPNGKNGPEVVCAIAGVGGTYSVAVRPLGETAAPGRYEVRRERTAPPSRARQEQRRRLASPLRSRAPAKEYQTALDYYSRALPLRPPAGNRSGEALTVLGAGRVYASLKQYEKALDYCERALSLMRATGNRSGEATALYSIAAAERDRGNFSRALTEIEAALEIIEDVRAKVASSQLRTSYVAAKHEYYELYIDLLMRLHKQHPEAGYDGRALHASERARARYELEILPQAGADIRAGADPKLVGRERALQQRIDAVEIKRMRLLGGSPTEAQKAELEKERESLIDQYQELQAQLRIASPRYACQKSSSKFSMPAHCC